MTENYAALPIIQRQLLEEEDDAVVIFGSSFPKDQEYTQVPSSSQNTICFAPNQPPPTLSQFFFVCYPLRHFTGLACVINGMSHTLGPGVCYSFD